MDQTEEKFALFLYNNNNNEVNRFISVSVLVKRALITGVKRAQAFKNHQKINFEIFIEY